MTAISAGIGALASQNLFLAYFILYVATIFLGNISAFAGFWFIFQGYFGEWGIPFLIVTIFCANVSGDMLWYSLGRGTHNTRLGEWIKRRIPGYKNVAAKVERNGKNLVFLSKFLYASSFPIIFAVGWTKMPFKRFIRNSVLSVLLWLPILLGLAYGVVSGLSPLRAIDIFKNLELFFAISLAIFILADYFVVKILGKLLNRSGNRKESKGDIIS